MGKIFDSAPDLGQLRSVTLRNVAAQASGKLAPDDATALGLLEHYQLPGAEEGFLAYGAPNFGSFMTLYAGQLFRNQPGLLTVDHDGVLIGRPDPMDYQRSRVGKFLRATSLIPSFLQGERLDAVLDHEGLAATQKLSEAGLIKAVGLTVSPGRLPRQGKIDATLRDAGFQANITDFPRHLATEFTWPYGAKGQFWQPLLAECNLLIPWLKEANMEGKVPLYLHFADILSALVPMTRANRGEEGRFIRGTDRLLQFFGINLTSRLVTINPMYPTVMGLTPEHYQFEPIG